MGNVGIVLNGACLGGFVGGTVGGALGFWLELEAATEFEEGITYLEYYGGDTGDVIKMGVTTGAVAGAAGGALVSADGMCS